MDQDSPRDPISGALGAIVHALTQPAPDPPPLLQSPEHPPATPRRKPPHDPARGPYGDPAKKTPNKRRTAAQNRQLALSPEVTRKLTSDPNIGPGQAQQAFTDIYQHGPRLTRLVGPQTPHDIAKYHAQRLKAEAGEAAHDPTQTYLAEQIHQKLGRRLTPEEADYLPKGPTEDAQRAAVFDVMSAGPGKIGADAVHAIASTLVDHMGFEGMEHMAARGMAAEEEATMGTARPRRRGRARAGPATVEGPKALPAPRPPEGEAISEPGAPLPPTREPGQVSGAEARRRAAGARDVQARTEGPGEARTTAEEPKKPRRGRPRKKTPNIAADLIGDIEKKNAGKEVTRSAEAPKPHAGADIVNYRFSTLKAPGGKGYIGRAFDKSSGKLLHETKAFDSSDQARAAAMEEMRGAAKESKKAGAAGRTAASGIRSKSPFDLQMFGRKNKSQPGSVKSIAELPIHVKHVLADFAKGIRDEGTRGKGYVATNLEEGTPVATRGAAVRSSRGEGALFNSKDVAHAKSIIRKGMGIRVSDAEAENLLGQMMHAEPWRARTLKDGRSFTMTNEDDRRAIMSPEEIKREDALMDDLMSTHQRVSAGAKSRQARELEQDIATGKQRPAVKEFMKKQRQEERRLKALQPKRPRGRPRKGGGGGGGQGGPGLFGAQSEGQLRGRLLKGRTPRQVLEDIIYGHPEDIANVTSGTGAIIEALRETVQDLRRKKRDSR